MSLCRSVIRQNLTKEGIEKGLVEELNLPGTIKDFLTYNRRKTTNPEVLKEADQMTDWPIEGAQAQVDQLLFSTNPST